MYRFNDIDDSNIMDALTTLAKQTAEKFCKPTDDGFDWETGDPKRRFYYHRKSGKVGEVVADHDGAWPQ